MPVIVKACVEISATTTRAMLAKTEAGFVALNSALLARLEKNETDATALEAR